MPALSTSRRSARLTAEESLESTTQSQLSAKAAKMPEASVPNEQRQALYGIQTAEKSSASPQTSAPSRSQTKRIPAPAVRYPMRRSIFSPANLLKSHADRRPAFPKTPFPLMSLPPEIRNMIYKFALPSAGAAFLAASRQIYQEAKGLIYQYGVLRITEDQLSRDNEVLPYHLTKGQLPLIENFSLDLYLHEQSWAGIAIARADSEWSTIWEDYGLGFTNRKSCNITVYAKWKLCLDHIQDFYRGFNFLKSFENLNVTFKDKMMRRVRKRSKKAGPGRLYEDLVAAWKRRFGPAIWHDHEKVTERYLEFHPLEHPMKSDWEEDEDDDGWW